MQLKNQKLFRTHTSIGEAFLVANSFGLSEVEEGDSTFRRYKVFLATVMIDVEMVS